MTVLKIYKAEDCDEQQLIRVFDEGEHIIGRNNLLCTDKRISRQHAILNISPENVTFKTLHVNPCFYTCVEGDQVVIIPKDNEVILGDNDKFGFLPDEYWYKVRICLENEDTDTTSSVGEKHSLPDEQLSQTVKKPRLEIVETFVDLSTQSTEFKEEEETLESTTQTVEESSKNAKMKVENNENTDNKPTNSDAPTDGAAKKPPDSQPSQSKERRERCWYGAQCFRKNPQHKANYSHPDDDDYASDSNDDRPCCSYGAVCYRRNMLHRRQYKHPNRPAPKPRKRAAKRKRPTGSVQYADSEDDYDYDDPFIDDSGSEYTMSSDGSDTEWEDSQNVEEDSQETRRMLKEAKRFTKK